MKLKYILLPLVAVGLFACKKTEAPKDVKIPPSPVLLGKVEVKDTFRTIDTLGSTTSFESVNIMPQVTGQIVALKFKQGDFVKKGQVLAEIDNRPFKAKVEAARAAIIKAKAQLEIDVLDVQRNEELAKKEFVSKQTFDALKAKVSVDKAVLASAEADLSLAEINLDWCSVRSPIDGKVGFFNINVGNIVNANMSVITTVENLSTLYVNFFAPSDKQFELQEIMKSNGGTMDVDVLYESPDGRKYSRVAKVHVFENSARYESSTIVMRAILDNRDFMFWPNQQVKTYLHTVSVKKGTFVNEAALSVDNVGYYLFVAKKLDDTIYQISKVKVNPVQLYSDGNYLVEGVKEGDIIVVKGQLRVAEGAFAYSATKEGDPIGADGKAITDEKKKFEFIQKATEAKYKRLPAPKSASSDSNAKSQNKKSQDEKQAEDSKSKEKGSAKK